MISYLADNPATFAAFLSAVAAIMAAITTLIGPRSAAKLAEHIRREADRENERRRMKLQVFSTLMQERATIASIDSVRMLNSIDFVFSDSPSVRDAWADLFSIFNNQDGLHPQLREEKLRTLLKEMAADVGLSNALKVDDIGRIYYPNAIAQEEELQMLQRRQALLQLRSNGQQQPAHSTVGEKLIEKFPPRPRQA